MTRRDAPTALSPTLQVLEEGSSTANYGFTRVFGSIGWGVSENLYDACGRFLGPPPTHRSSAHVQAFAPVAGYIYDAAGAPAAFLTFLVFLCAAAVLAWWLPLEHERLFQSRGSSEPPAEQAPIHATKTHTSADAKDIEPSHVLAVATAGDAGAGSGSASGQLQSEELRPTLSPTSVDTPDCAIAVAAAEARSQAPDISAQHAAGAAPGLRRLVSPDALLIFCTATIMGMLAVSVIAVKPAAHSCPPSSPPPELHRQLPVHLPARAGGVGKPSGSRAPLFNSLRGTHVHSLPCHPAPRGNTRDSCGELEAAFAVADGVACETLVDDSRRPPCWDMLCV